MLIIPAPHPTQAATRHSRELGKRVEQLVRDYRREHPELTDDEIRAALAQSSLVSDDADQERQQRGKAMVAIALALGIAGLVAALVLGRAAETGGGAGSGSWPVVSIIVAVLVVALAVVRVVSRR
jgi:hypothetical protein